MFLLYLFYLKFNENFGDKFHNVDFKYVFGVCCVFFVFHLFKVKKS